MIGLIALRIVVVNARAATVCAAIEVTGDTKERERGGIIAIWGAAGWGRLRQSGKEPGAGGAGGGQIPAVILLCDCGQERAIRGLAARAKIVNNTQAESGIDRPIAGKPARLRKQTLPVPSRRGLESRRTGRKMGCLIDGGSFN